MKSADTGSVLKTIEDIPKEFILSFESGNNFMDVFVPTDCIKKNNALFKAFLDSRAKLIVGARLRLVPEWRPTPLFALSPFPSFTFAPR
ncbi:hypothetical protein HPB47_017436 [Ixodes persulcatus]|uniref:Uncharacterized protein n=1 Tax=Ixodes persulcatus TaxID=34615 RepID=A0AC60QQB6_IXOPE|nr:hypothetical protein HPB47_017436 [Ixodes persulcatus]